MQEGDRTLAEQLLGLEPALAEARGKTVLDLGCAEGLIALEFAKAGAAAVQGYDYNAALLEVAQAELAKAAPLPVTLEHADIEDMWRAGARLQYHIVLALAVLHKLTDPAAGVRFCAASARSLIVIRLPKGSTGAFRGKHAQHMRADLAQILPACGFRRERKEPGPRGEWVQYWRRSSGD